MILYSPRSLRPGIRGESVYQDGEDGVAATWVTVASMGLHDIEGQGWREAGLRLWIFVLSAGA